MYSIIKLTVKNRSTIKSGSVVEIEVNEEVFIPYVKGLGYKAYGQFFLRKSLAKRGVIQTVFTPFPEGYIGKPLVVLKNDDVSDIELLAGDELGELWVFDK